jgi:hypothetical protein
MPTGSSVVAGRLWAVHVVPPFLVAITAALPWPSPTAQQSDVVEHEMDPSNPSVGVLCVTHVFPASSVAMTLAWAPRWPPTAQQSAAPEHEMLRSNPVPGGTLCTDQEAPPLMVATTSLASDVPEMAQHCSALTQAMLTTPTD